MKRRSIWTDREFWLKPLVVIATLFALGIGMVLYGPPVDGAGSGLIGIAAGLVVLALIMAFKIDRDLRRKYP